MYHPPLLLLPPPLKLRLAMDQPPGLSRPLPPWTPLVWGVIERETHDLTKLLQIFVLINTRRVVYKGLVGSYDIVQ